MNQSKFYKWKRSWKKDRPFLLMCIPALVFFLIFAYLPMPGIYVAFVNFNYNKGIFGSEFVGFNNLKFIFMSGKLGMLVRNTVLYNIAFILTSTTMQILIALLFNELKNKYFRKFAQSFMILPNFISYVLVGVFGFALFNSTNGIFNTIIQNLGGESKNFYSDPAIWPVILVIINLWKGAGYGSIVYFAALMGMDAEMFEAAKVDGVNSWQKILYITLPCLRPTVIILFLLSIGGILRGNFDLFYNMIGGSNVLLLDTTDVLETFIFRAMVSNANFSTAAAVSFVQSIFGLVLVLTTNTIVKKFEPDYALF
ncbi:MAG: ABC transporter permease subunit [Clostridiales bacterium]|jgi:putative aldouronate transport system permease protein|nr:ABC transporter permease subunit [Clostridiales bacterium]